MYFRKFQSTFTILHTKKKLIDLSYRKRSKRSKNKLIEKDLSARFTMRTLILIFENVKNENRRKSSTIWRSRTTLLFCQISAVVEEAFFFEFFVSVTSESRHGAGGRSRRFVFTFRIHIYPEISSETITRSLPCRYVRISKQKIHNKNIAFLSILDNRSAPRKIFQFLSDRIKEIDTTLFY